MSPSILYGRMDAKLHRTYKVPVSNLVRGKKAAHPDSPPTRPHKDTMKIVTRVSRRLHFPVPQPGFITWGEVMYIPQTPERKYQPDDDKIWTEV